MKASPAIVTFRVVTTTIIVALSLLFVLGIFGQGPLTGKIPLLP